MNVTPLKTDDFAANLVADDGRVSLQLHGNADIRVMFSLEKMLAQLETQVKGQGVKEVIVDLRQLEFMNSSCFKSFVLWLSHVQEYEPDHQYRFRFLSDPNKHWQARSLTALSCFAVDLVHVET